MNALNDAHCHLDWVADAPSLAAQARRAGMRIFCNTVTPEGFRAARARFAGDERFSLVRLGLGLHPWYIADDPAAGGPALPANRAESLLASFERAFDEIAGEATEPTGLESTGITPTGLAPTGITPTGLAPTLFLGEVGLDFSKRRVSNAASQRAAFTHVAALAAKRGDCVLSIHAVKAADEVLDSLEASGALSNCTCVFHWFSGSDEALRRAIGAGCLFSINEGMAASRRGRAYLGMIPVDRLLLETDAPGGPGEPYAYAEMRASLQRALDAVAAIKGASAADVIAATATRVFAERA